MSGAFRVKSNGISNKLIADVQVSSGDNSITVAALWDTGATCCCVSKEVVDYLSPTKVGSIKIKTASTAGELRDTYLVDLVLPNNVSIPNVTVVCCEIGAQNVGLLVGMDIISQGDFLITNHGTTVFSFRMPPEPLPNFVSGVSVSNILNGRKNNKSAYRPKSRRR